MADWDNPGASSWDANDPGTGGGATSSFGDTGGMNDNERFGNDDGDAGDNAGGSGGRSGACFNCGKEGHNKAECTEPRVMRCRHCNKEGHTIRRCPEPDCPPQEESEFTGQCNYCKQDGHRASDCPDRPPLTCKNCKQEGHQAAECKNPRVIDRSGIADVSADDAWELMVKAVNEQDMDDLKDAIQKYLKSQPELTYVELEKAFRIQEIGVWIIAIEKPSMIDALTNMDLQGNLNKKYQASYRFSDKAARPRERPFWPKDNEENLERLKDAGEPVERGIMKCFNCEKYGHGTKNCPEEKVDKSETTVTVKCFNCGEEGHRVRDCPIPRVDKFACKNCGKPGHRVADCPEPPNPANVECRKCNEKGHFSRDCPQGGGGGGGGCHNCGQEGHRAKDCPEPKKIKCRNCDGEGHTSRECPEPRDMSKVQCRNCDEYGHTGKDCPKPRDISRVKCSNCGEMGHFKSRCSNPTVDPDRAMDTGDMDRGMGGGMDRGMGDDYSGGGW